MPEIQKQGEIRTAAGEVVGLHSGIAGFTVGQRQGLPASNQGPRYVTRIDASTNTIIIGREEELDAFALTADELNVIRPEYFSEPRSPVLAMVRYRAKPVPALATVRESTLDLQFEEPLKAISPGQLVAMFDRDGEEVLGAATIRSTP